MLGVLCRPEWTIVHWMPIACFCARPTEHVVIVEQTPRANWKVTTEQSQKTSPSQYFPTVPRATMIVKGPHANKPWAHFGIHSVTASSLKKDCSSCSTCETGCTIWSCLVDLVARTRMLTKAAKENMATTPKSGKANAGTALESFFVGVASCCTSVTSLASYFRAVGGAVSQGLEGVGSGTGTTGAGAGTGTGTTGAQ